MGETKGYKSYKRLATKYGTSIQGLKKVLVAAGHLVGTEPTESAVSAGVARRVEFDGRYGEDDRNFAWWWDEAKVDDLMRGTAAGSNAGFAAGTTTQAERQVEKAAMVLRMAGVTLPRDLLPEMGWMEHDAIEITLAAKGTPRKAVGAFLRGKVAKVLAHVSQRPDDEACAKAQRHLQAALDFFERGRAPLTPMEVGPKAARRSA